MSFEDTFAIADAMATRQGKMAAIIAQISMSLQGIPYQAPSAEEVRQAHIGHQIFMMSRIENPNKAIKIEDLFDTNGDDSSYVALADALSAINETKVDAESVKEYMLAFAGEFKKGVENFDEKMVQNFASMLKAARDIAVERNVTVADVYLTDELYYEATRRSSTLEESAKTFCDGLEAFSDEMFNRIIVGQIQNILPKEMLASLTPEDLNEFVIEMQLNPTIQEELRGQVELGREGLRQAADYILSVTYGDDAISRLSIEQQELLTPRKGRVPDHIDFTT